MSVWSVWGEHMFVQGYFTSPKDEWNSPTQKQRIRLQLLKVNVGQLRIKNKLGVAGVSFGLTHQFSDQNHKHENSVETLCLYYRQHCQFTLTQKSDHSYINMIMWFKN